jgi:hypothetical protein
MYVCVYFSLRSKTGNVLLCNIEARSCERCFSGKLISITYSECVFVALCIQHAIRMRYIVICGLPGSTVYFHISLTVLFKKKKLVNPLNAELNPICHLLILLGDLTFESVHRKYIPIYIQQDATLRSLFISGNYSTPFGWYFHL